MWFGTVTKTGMVSLYNNRYRVDDMLISRKGRTGVRPFHGVKLVTDALEALRWQVWQAARSLPDKRIAKTFKGARASVRGGAGDPYRIRSASRWGDCQLM